MLHNLRWSYIFKHWAGTIILGTILVTISPGFNPLNSSSIGQKILFSIVPLFYSVIYSIPTLICNLLAFYWFKDNTLNVNWIKMTLILITMAGITLTIASIGGSLELALCYSIAAIVTGILFKIGKV